MDIGLTSPYAHPHVHRGTERYLHELAAWLASRSHAVEIVTSTRGPSTRAVDEGGVPVSYGHRGPPRGRGSWAIDDIVRTGPPIARRVRSLTADVVQSHHYVDAAAVRLGRLGQPVPYVIWMPGAAPRSLLRGKPWHRRAFQLAVNGAARIHSLSEYAKRVLLEEFGVESDHVPPGVDTRRYEGPKTVDESPMILCTAAAGESRKRVDQLVQAFPKVLADRPTCRLVLATADRAAAERLLGGLDDEARGRAAVRSGLDADELAGLYREAAMTVLPSIREAFGLVVVESLAAGTPVAVTDHGALPELVDEGSTGFLFGPEDPDAVARAIVATLDLADDPATVARCRAAAQRWDWAEVGPTIEGIYGQLVR
ncbi:MAG: glycogen synthase [Actinomycetota bacterium]|jgi:glycosyltransferase involved in cell wall biosynthesis|nr:glycogen synthase [Actinomycetota bacterium]